MFVVGLSAVMIEAPGIITQKLSSAFKTVLVSKYYHEHLQHCEKQMRIRGDAGEAMVKGYRGARGGRERDR